MCLVHPQEQYKCIEFLVTNALWWYTVSLLYDLAGGSACRRGPCDLHCISPLISLWRPYPTSFSTRAAVWLVFLASSHVNKIKKCLVLLAVSSKCLRIHYNKEYSCTIRMLLHHPVGKLQDDFKLIIQACVFRVDRPFVCLSINLGRWDQF